MQNYRWSPILCTKHNQNGISRNVLIHQIETNLYSKETAKPSTNFEATLPPLQSDLAKEITKTLIILIFMPYQRLSRKRARKCLTDNITKFYLN